MLFGIMASQPPASVGPIACVYPLDASEAYITSTITASGKLTMSVDEQAGSYVLAATAQTYGAMREGGWLSGGGSASPIDMTSANEIKALELQLPALPAITEGVGSYRVTVYLVSPLVTGTFYGFRITANADGTFDIEGIGGSSGTIATGLATAPTSVAFMYNSATSQRFFRFDGVDYLVGTLGSSVAAGLDVTLTVQELSGVTGADIGKTVTARVETQAVNFTGSYDTGTLDPCGNLVAGVVYPLDATLAELTGAGLDGKLTVIDEQSGSYTYPDGIISDNVGMAAGLSSPHAVLDLSVGAVAIELEVTIPSYTPEVVGSGVAITGSRISMLNGTTFAPEVLIGMVARDDGQYQLFVNDGFGATTFFTTSGSHRLGILFDNAGGATRLWQDDVELVVPNDALPPSINNLRLLIEVANNSADDNGLAGLTTVLDLVTEPSEFTTTFPAGSRDINGNVFN